MNTRGMIWIYGLLAMLQRPERGSRGATTAEYGLIAGLCVLAFVGGIEALRMALGALFGAQQDAADGWVP